MPAIEFSEIDAAIVEVRNAYGARAGALDALDSSKEILAQDQAKVTAAEEALVPLQEAWIEAVRKLQEATAKLNNL